MSDQDFTVERVGDSFIIRLASWNGGYQIQVVPDPNGQGIIVVNRTNRSRCIYQHKLDHNKLLLSDAEPKTTWKEFEPR